MAAEHIITAAAYDDTGALLGQCLYNNGLGDISAVIQGLQEHAEKDS